MREDDLKLTQINAICPKCGNSNYLILMTGNNVGKLNVKCLNCSSSFEWQDVAGVHPMTIDRAMKLLRIERECVSRDCDRKCAECDLVQDRDELIDMYNWVLDYIDQKERE